MYGLHDESMKDVAADKREEVTREVFRLFDQGRNGVVEREEWMEACAKGVQLPDFGVSGCLKEEKIMVGLKWMCNGWC